MARPRKTKSGVRINPKTGKAETGRPTVMTPDVLSKLETAYSYGCKDTEACFFADISLSALYAHQKTNPEFKERKELLRKRPVMLARKAVVEAIAGNKAKGKEPDARLGMEYLVRTEKDEFSSRQELTGAKGRPLNPPKKMTLEERKKFAAEILATEKMSLAKPKHKKGAGDE